MAKNASEELVVILGKTEYTIAMPTGHYRVLRGAAKPTDLYLDALELKRSGEVRFLAVGDIDRVVQSCEFECLIRKGSKVDRACEKCHGRAARSKKRYCVYCENQLVREWRMR